MASAIATMSDQGVLLLEGDLVFANVTAVLGDIDKQLPGNKALVIDLSRVGDVDSSGLALLLEVMERSKRLGIALRFCGLSDALLGIARLSNVEGLLPIDGPEGV
jgi:phospholipid transport system transporter-binding protein